MLRKPLQNDRLRHWAANTGIQIKQKGQKENTNQSKKGQKENTDQGKKGQKENTNQGKKGQIATAEEKEKEAKTSNRTQTDEPHRWQFA